MVWANNGKCPKCDGKIYFFVEYDLAVKDLTKEQRRRCVEDCGSVPETGSVLVSEWYYPCGCFGW